MPTTDFSGFVMSVRPIRSDISETCCAAYDVRKIHPVLARKALRTEHIECPTLAAHLLLMD
jgi:hypothetical protein